MLNHLAIIVVGKANSGKTTTLKHFCDTYYTKVATFKQGWRIGLMPFLDNYLGVKINAYFLPSSRTEKGKSLKKTLEGLNWKPDFLFMAEQFQGNEYNNTIRFLRENNYHIKEFVLDDTNSDSIWRYYADKKDEQLYLTHRTEQIADYVRSFILSRI